jgi:hypothetical protein
MFCDFRACCCKPQAGTTALDFLVPTFLSVWEPKPERTARSPRDVRTRAAAALDAGGNDEDEHSGGSSADEELDDDGMSAYLNVPVYTGFDFNFRCVAALQLYDTRVLTCSQIMAR